SRVYRARRVDEAHPDDDRRVIEAVADDEIRLAGDGRDHTGVGREPGLERQYRRGALELGELRLEGLVHRHRPGDGPDRTRPDPEVADGGEGRVAESRMVG